MTKPSTYRNLILLWAGIAIIPEEDQEQLVAFLLRVGAPPPLEEGVAAGDAASLAVILLTRDQLFSHTVMTSCAVRSIFVFATDEPRISRTSSSSRSRGT